MKKFAIDLKNSEKGERKKVVKYLRSQGFVVIKRKDDIRPFNYLVMAEDFNFLGCDFHYIASLPTVSTILTLSRDWYKLRDIVEGSNSTDWSWHVYSLASPMIERIGKYVVNENLCIIPYEAVFLSEMDTVRCVFDTKKEAEKYVEENKPMYSKKDLEKAVTDSRKIKLEGSPDKKWLNELHAHLKENLGQISYDVENFDEQICEGVDYKHVLKHGFTEIKIKVQY